MALLEDTDIPVEEEESSPESSGPLSLTGVKSIDDLLIRLGDVALSEKVSAYVFANMKARPGAAAKVKRAVYTAYGDRRFTNKGIKEAPYEFSYTLTDDDITMLARALRGECGPPSKDMGTKPEVEAWMFFYRFMLNPNHFGTRSFARCCMYATATLNPIWYRTGSMCRLGGKYHDKEECSEKIQSKRDKTRLGEVFPAYMKIAERLAVGTLPRPGKVYIDVGNPKLKGIVDYGDNVEGHGDYFLTAEKLFAWQPNKQIIFADGDVALMGFKYVFPDNPRGPLDPKGKLYEHVIATIIGEERASRNAIVDKSAIYARASANAQRSAENLSQQTANVIQMTTTLQAITPGTFGSISTDSRGQQVGSDDTWNRV